jgi:hypothetical protein
VTLQNCNASQLPCRPWTINRFLSFSLPSNIAGQSTALRVELTSLHHPNPLPPGPPPPDFSAFEGQFRYVNLVASTPNRCCTDSLQCNRTATCNSDADCVGMLVQPPFINTPAPTCRPNLCGDSASFATFYPCAKLGCTPEYRDWDADFEGRIVYVFGDAVVPDSIYNVALLDATCAGNEEECGAASAELSIATARWGNVDGSVAVIPGAQDVGWVVSKIKDAPGSFIEPRALLREATVNPHGTATAQDCSRSIDTCKGFNYGFTISQCP